MRRDELIDKAARKRGAAAKIDAQITARTADPMAEHFPVGAGAARPSGQRRRPASRQRPNAADERTWALMSQRDSLISEAEQLERTARSTVFADDLEGLHALCVKRGDLVDELVAKKADAAARAKFGADVIQSCLTTARRQLREAIKRLETAERYAPRPGLHGHSLRAAQATVALLNTQDDRPGPRKVIEISARDWDADDSCGAETRRGLVDAERSGLVEQDPNTRTWAATDLGRELFDGESYDELAGMAEQPSPPTREARHV